MNMIIHGRKKPFREEPRPDNYVRNTFYSLKASTGRANGTLHLFLGRAFWSGSNLRFET